MESFDHIEYATSSRKHSASHTNSQYQQKGSVIHEENKNPSPSSLPLTYTLPTWLQHAHVVHTVDLKVESDCARDSQDIESGIFIRTHKTRMHGDLFIPRRNPESGRYEIVRQK